MQTLKKDFNEISVKRGELFAIELPSNPSSGYQWKVSVKEGKALLLSENFQTPEAAGNKKGKGMYIGPGTLRYVFMAESAENIKISAEYRQAWNTAQVTPVNFKVRIS